MKKIFIGLILTLLIFLSGTGFLKTKPEAGDPEDLRKFSSLMRGFSFDIFFQLAGEDNLFISPYSIHTAVSMAYLGADGDTAEEMGAVLNLKEIDPENMLEDSFSLKKYLEDFSAENKLSIANALFLREDIPFLDSYKASVRNYFEAEISALPETGEPVNDWVYEKTRQKIDGIIDEGPIDEEVLSYLVNAIYFKGIWNQEFDEEKTGQDTFYAPGGEVKIDMMENRGVYKFAVSEFVKALTIEYREGDYLFHVFMPTDGRTLRDFYQDFDIQRFEDMKPTEPREIVLRFPKFTLEDDLSLLEALNELGINKAFDGREADFSKMADLEKLEALNIFISDVLHASFIEVDEKGTEAAALTAVEIRAVSAPMPVEFNKPFFFIIEEPETGTILFLGQLINP